MHSYTPPWILFNRHLETIYPSLLRKVDAPVPETERIETPDDDFLDIDWYRGSTGTCLIISHGLEGNSSRSYVRGMARAFHAQGHSVLAWNFRGCSEEINRQRRFYHSGATDDLGTVVAHATRQYDRIWLLGFSLGGNVTLKYLGEGNLPPQLKAGVGISVPLDLYTSCLEICRGSNWIYSQRFLRSLEKKVLAKAARRDDLPTKDLSRVKNLMDFDEYFTGPIHGFAGAIDYYTRSSSLPFLRHIRVPTLLVNAANDPFLGPKCYPEEHLTANSLITTEFPERGGHVGFARFKGNGLYWSEMRALEFLNVQG